MLSSVKLMNAALIVYGVITVPFLCFHLLESLLKHL